MTHHDDHRPAMTRLPSQLRRRFADRDLDALLGNGGTPSSTDLQEVASYLTTLHTLVELPTPRPSPELAAVLTHGWVPTAPAPSPARPIQHPAGSTWLRRRALALGLSAGIAASLAGVAAASDRLPDSAQNVWDRLVEAVTPFAVHDPRRPDPTGTHPADRGPGASEPSPDPEQGPGLTATPPSMQDEGPDQPTARRSAETSATDPDNTVRNSKETVEGSDDDSSTTVEPGEVDTGSSGSAEEDADGDGAQTDKTTQAGNKESAGDGDAEPDTSVLPYAETQPSQPEPDSTDLTEIDDQ